MISIFKTSSREYLGYPQFAATFMLTVLFHILAGIGWYMSPHMHIIDIPVRAINIRLGDSDVQQQVADEEDAPQPEPNTSQQVEDAMTKLIRRNPTSKPVKKAPTPHVVKPPETTEKTPPKTPVPNDKPDSPRQFVRFNENVDEKNIGSALGNSTDSTADVKAIYEKTISLWIKKFQIYPEAARLAGVEGKTVLRIRVDRRGNIRYSALEGTTGSLELDRAALDMVRRANPVPAMPDNYGQGEMQEFLIPVNFNFK